MTADTRIRGLLLAGAAVLWLAGLHASADPVRPYRLDYDVELHPQQGVASVAVELGKQADRVRWIRFHIDPRYQRDFAADGGIEQQGEYVTWHPPEDGGTFRLTVEIDHKRRSGSYDARMTDDWAVLRGDDLVPPARVRTVVGAESRASLGIGVPEGWSVYTAYPEDEEAPDRFRVDRPDRRFDRPVGWIVAGKLGVRRERIAGVSVIVAGPVGHDIRRQDMLAFLNWNLPGLMTAFPDFPRLLLIVSAGDPMWRGGLSSPNSVYIHAERPLISGNGTSTLLHELVHVATGLEGAPGADWIIEGMAEYYSLEVQRRTGSISGRRFELALRSLKRWSEDVDDLGRSRAGGEITARAVLVMHATDEEIRERTKGLANLDDVARRLAALDRDIELEDLRETAAAVAGAPLDALRDGALPLL